MIIRKESAIIIVANPMPVKRGYEEELEKVFRNGLGLVDKMPGF